MGLPTLKLLIEALARAPSGVPRSIWASAETTFDRHRSFCPRLSLTAKFGFPETEPWFWRRRRNEGGRPTFSQIGSR